MLEKIGKERILLSSNDKISKFTLVKRRIHIVNPVTPHTNT